MNVPGLLDRHGSVKSVVRSAEAAGYSLPVLHALSCWFGHTDSFGRAGLSVGYQSPYTFADQKQHRHDHTDSARDDEHEEARYVGHTFRDPRDQEGEPVHQHERQQNVADDCEARSRGRTPIGQRSNAEPTTSGRKRIAELYEDQPTNPDQYRVYVRQTLDEPVALRGPRRHRRDRIKPAREQPDSSHHQDTTYDAEIPTEGHTSP